MKTMAMKWSAWVIGGLLGSGSVIAEAAPEGTAVADVRDAWSPEHPFGIGGRATAWVGPYNAPGLGGHIKFRPWEAIGVEAFSDNFAMVQDDAWRHDHVIGFSLFAPSLIGTHAWYIAPTLGTCVDFRFAHPNNEAPSTSDILFGIHGGLMAEVFVEHGFSFEFTATLYGYVGHETGIERWSSTVSTDLGWTAVGHVAGVVNYYF